VYVYRVAQGRVRDLSFRCGGQLLADFGVGAELAERIRRGRHARHFVGTADLPHFFRKPYGPGWALVGDAGHHKDPCGGYGISDAFRDAELLAKAIDAGLWGRRPLDEALADYERERNESTMPSYELNHQIASLQPPRPKTQRLYAALAGNQADTDRFIGTLMGTVPIAEFYSPENISRITERQSGEEQSALLIDNSAQTIPSDLFAQFAAAASAVQGLPRRPDNASLLKLYALYKQSTSGDVVGTRPGAMNFCCASQIRRLGDTPGNDAGNGDARIYCSCRKVER
jgi:acyl-CoA-binding protein